MIRIGILAAALTLVVGCQRSSSALPSGDEIIALEKSLAVHEKAHDVEFFRQTLADDVMDVGLDGKIYGKEFVLKGIGDPDLVVGTVTMSDFEVRVLSAEGATVSYDATVQGSSYKGQPYPAETHNSSVWVKRGGRWQLLLHQATLRTTPAGH